MENENLLQDFYDQIDAELSFCDGSKTPLICANLTSAENRKKLIETIAKTSIEGKLEISQAITEVERLYGTSDID